MTLPLEPPLLAGRKQSAAGPVTIVPDLRSFRYDPRSVRLSPMQMLVVQLVCCGLADKEIAFILGVSSATVKAHMSRAIKDMGLFRRHQLVRFIFENGLFDPERAQSEILKRRSAKLNPQDAARAA
jgi:DNA-binding NarL/FixJ family response regulator